MKLIVLVPSYDRDVQLQKIVRDIEEFLPHEALMVLRQEKDAPLGMSTARSHLCAEAYRRYGDGNALLMLDDDCIINANVGAGVHWAMELFNDPLTGIIHFPNRRWMSKTVQKTARDYQAKKSYIYHALMIRSDLIGRGLNYRPGEYFDDIDLTPRAFLAGWDLVETKRAYITHHVTMRGVEGAGDNAGGNEAAMKNGVKVQSTLTEDLKGWYSFITNERDGVELLKCSSLRLLPAGQRKHERMQAELRRELGI